MAEEGESKKIPRHGVPKGSRTKNQELLYDVNVATSTHAEQARTLAEKMSTATLCTISEKSDGYPYGSFVTYAMYDGCPIFLISVLAEHTKNLEAESRASLMVSEAGEGNPLALGRVTLLGECEKLPKDDDSRLREAFLERHPNASFYVDFEDFSFYRLRVSEARYIGGFGRMSWVDGSDWEAAEPDPLFESVEDILSHMNEDHEDAMVIICKEMSKAKDTASATMTGIDRYGFEMSAMTAEGPRPIRIGFENEATDSEEARKEIVSLVRRARDNV
ncbi:MAG TPA: HugZ family protein [Candidatus Thalassarchaeaceae archaeon]|nr:MAG TPA: HugZ family protein [Candidatus Poseidoniales archaeon]HII90397.1 HugZ family protein [Candidatus Thalassarchaeaceae archaeon]